MWSSFCACPILAVPSHAVTRLLLPILLPSTHSQQVPPPHWESLAALGCSRNFKPIPPVQTQIQPSLLLPAGFAAPALGKKIQFKTQPNHHSPSQLPKHSELSPVATPNPKSTLLPPMPSDLAVPCEECPFCWDRGHCSPSHLGYSRHEAELDASFDPFPLLDVVSGNDALPAHLVLRLVPVGILWGQQGVTKSLWPPEEPAGGSPSTPVSPLLAAGKDGMSRAWGSVLGSPNPVL